LSNTTGNFNTAIVHSALANNTTGSNNLVLGSNGGGITTANGVTCIASFGGNVTSSCFIGQVTRGRRRTTLMHIPVVIDSADQLGTVSSSRRFKKEIKLMDSASEAILALKTSDVSLQE